MLNGRIPAKRDAHDAAARVGYRVGNVANDHPAPTATIRALAGDEKSYNFIAGQAVVERQSNTPAADVQQLAH